MDCRNCGYCWADVDEDGAPLSFEYCHFDGPDGWAPCAQDEYDEYANEAYVEEENAREEAEYVEWLKSIPLEQRPANTEEYVNMWIQYRAMYESED